MKYILPALLASVSLVFAGEPKCVPPPKKCTPPPAKCPPGSVKQKQSQGQGQNQSARANNLNSNTFNPTNTFNPVNRNNNVNKAGVNRSGNSRNKNKTSNVNRVNPNINSGSTVRNVDNSTSMGTTIPSFTMSVDYLTWKASRKTAEGVIISHFDPRAAHRAAPKPMPKDAKERYNAFLMAKGINPHTLGHSTITSDRTLDVPTIEEQYAKHNSQATQMLKLAAE